MTYLEEQIQRESERLMLELSGLAARAMSAGVYLKGEFGPSGGVFEMHRSATVKEMRSGQTSVKIAGGQYKWN